MHIRITADANVESGVGEFVSEISGPTRKHFADKNYGAGLTGLVIVLMCRNPDFKFKQRIRLVKKEKILYMDIMLDLDEMKNTDNSFRKRIIVERIANEVPVVLTKYSISDFDEARFIGDLDNWLKSII